MLSSSLVPRRSPLPPPILLLTTKTAPPQLFISLDSLCIKPKPLRAVTHDHPRFALNSVHSTLNAQNFNDEGVGACDSGEYCHFVHPGPRWAGARPYNKNPYDLQHIPPSYRDGGSRGRPGGGGGGGRAPRRCRVSLFGSSAFLPTSHVRAFTMVSVLRRFRRSRLDRFHI